jgi:hypothetical protein
MPGPDFVIELATITLIVDGSVAGGLDVMPVPLVQRVSRGPRLRRYRRGLARFLIQDSNRPLVRRLCVLVRIADGSEACSS